MEEIVTGDYFMYYVLNVTFSSVDIYDSFKSFYRKSIILPPSWNYNQQNHENKTSVIGIQVVNSIRFEGIESTDIVVDILFVSRFVIY